MNPEINSYTTQFEQLKSTFIGNHLSWLRAARETSLMRFLEMDFPNRHQENWKYTDLTFLAQYTFTKTIPSSNEINFASELAKKMPSKLVFINGYFSAALSEINHLPEGVTLMPLNEALTNQSEQIAPYLTETLSRTSPLLHLNTAFLTDGIFLHIAKNTHLKQPIHFLFLSDENQNNMLINYRNIILLEENCQAALFEQHQQFSRNNCDTQLLAFKNIYTQILLKSGAHLDYYKLQQEPKNTIHIAQTDINQDSNSQLYSHSISLGARLARDNLNVHLNAAGAFCELNGLYAPADTQHIDHHIRVDHFYPHGTSNICYKGILTDRAKGVFNGKVIVHPQAQKTQSKQINKNMLLSKTAEMNTKPELEIYADDVQCTHGATVGQISKEALFYLRSRGISEADAIIILTQAFYADILSHMRHTEIVDYIKKEISL